MAHQDRSRREAIRAQAARWLVRLGDLQGADPAERAAFEAWRAQGPEYEAAYERERATWEAMDRLRAFNPGEAPDADLLAPGRFVDPTPRRRERWATRGPSRWATAAAVVLAVTGLALTWVSLSADPAFATAVGEHRVVLLADGTRVELNTDTRIEVRYRRGVRQVRLVHGEAFFELHKDARPFLVVTPDTRLQAAGSAFEVRLRPVGTEVVVTQGAVSVQPVELRTASAQPIALGVGQEGLYGGVGGSAHPVSGEEVDRMLAWRQGAIDLHGQTLADAVDEFNRYNARRLVVADESISGLKLGGYFRADDVEGFVRALRATFPVQASSTRDGTIYLSRAGSRA
jgi:transmembrane sensor